MKKNWMPSLNIELRIAYIIAEQARNGWMFDVAGAKQLLNDIEASMQAIDSQLRPSLPKRPKPYGATVKKPFKINGQPSKMVTDWGLEVDGPFSRVLFEDLNLGSDKQIKEYLLEEGWRPTMWNFSKKTGDRTSPKLSEMGKLCPNLEAMDSEGGEMITEYLQLKHRKGLVEGLLNVVREDGRIPAEANTVGAATHRMTHKKVVNIPGTGAYLGERIRKLFISKPGYKIIGCDSKSNQVRMLCHYMNDSDYTYEVLNGDIHSKNQELAGLDTRAQAKTFFYGFMFGAGDTKIGKIVGGNASDGARLRARFLNNLPKLSRLITAIKKMVQKQGYVHGLDGRKVYISSDHKALNYLLQSAEAIYMKYSQAFLWKWIQKEGLDAKFVATVHDEYQIEVRDDHVDRVSQLCLNAMLKAGEFLDIRVPMEGDVHVGNDWSETH